MISSFFSKAKPIHIATICVLLLFVFIITKTNTLSEPLTFQLFFEQTLYFSFILASLFLLDFLVSRNNLTKKNSYKILMFGLFITVLPETLCNTKILLANLFILLAFRRIISLRSQKEIKKKLFDSAFWISLAALLYFWASLFFILIFAAMILYSITGVKNWIVPFTGVIAVAVITMSLMMIFNIDFVAYLNDFWAYSFDFTGLNSKRIIIATTILISYGTWASFFFIKHIKNKAKTYRPSFVLVIISSLIGLLIIAVSPNKTGSEFLFLFAPLAIIMTNYLEVIEETWFKEVIVWVLVITPIIALVL